MKPSRKQLRKPSEAIRKALAANVRAHRARLGFSQEDLAAAAGLHRTYVGAVERSERNVTLSSLEALASALGVTVPELLAPGGGDKRG
jgi:transcriptional regulator with XRE-family HTH domain